MQVEFVLGLPGKYDTLSYTLTASYFTVIFTHLKLCLAYAIHNFKWVNMIQIWQNGDQRFLFSVDHAC